MMTETYSESGYASAETRSQERYTVVDVNDDQFGLLDAQTGSLVLTEAGNLYAAPYSSAVWVAKMMNKSR